MHRKIWRGGAITGVCLALITGGYALGEYRASHMSFEESAGGACSRLTGDRNDEEINAVAPAAQTFAVRESVLQRRGYYNGYCTATAGEDQILFVSVEFVGLQDFDAWNQKIGDGWVEQEGRRRLKVAGGGWTGRSEAAVFVPCTLSDPSSIDKDGGLSVLVRTNDDGDYREQVTTIVKRAARETSSSTGPCDVSAD